MSTRNDAYNQEPTTTPFIKQSQREEQYLRACARYQSNVDAGVIVTIRHELEAYKPSIKLKDKDLLAVCEALSELTHLHVLHLNKCSITCNGAYLCCELLRRNKNIIELDLSQNQISDLGAQALSEILQIEDSKLKKLVVHYNMITKKGALHLAQGLRLNSCLEELDVSNNSLGSYGAKIIRVALMERAMAQNGKIPMLMIEPVESTMNQNESDDNNEQKNDRNDSNSVNTLSVTNEIHQNHTEHRESNSNVVALRSNHPSNSSVAIQTLTVSRNLEITGDQNAGSGSLSRSRSDIRSPRIPSQWIMDKWVSPSQLRYMQESMGVFINFEGNFLKEEVFNSVTHGVGLILAVIASAVLMSDASRYSTLCQVACGIFSFTLFFMYLASTLYHSFVHCLCARHVFHVLDFSSIFLLIAGTYTPILLIGFRHSPFHSLILFVGMWTLALFGVGYSSYVDPHDAKWKKLMILYLAMSYSGLVCVYPIVLTFPTMAWLLIFGGGLFYTAGVWFISNAAVVPIYHTIWHICVIFGSACHFMCILLYIVPMDVVERPSQELTFAHVVDNLFFGIGLFAAPGMGHAEL